MAKDTDLSQRGAWVEGEAEAQELIFAISDAVTSVEIPTYDEATKTESTKPTNWEEVYRSTHEKWVTYQPQIKTNVVGQYRHTDGKDYPVIKLPDYNNLQHANGGGLAVDPADGLLHEVEQSYSNIRTGRSIQVKQFEYLDMRETFPTTQFKDVPGTLVVNVEDPTKAVGYTAYMVEQVMPLVDGTTEPSDQWNMYELVWELPGDWSYALVPGFRYYWDYQKWYNGWNNSYSMQYIDPSNDKYKFGELYYTADRVHSVNPQVVLKATPEIDPALDIPTRDYYVLMEQPIKDFNYFDICHGVGFEGQGSIGDPTVTYDGICDPSTVIPGNVPVIIDQMKAHNMYQMWNDDTATPLYNPPKLSWEIDYDGVTEIISPYSHFFHGRNSTTHWLPNKKRRPDYLVGFSASVNNDRIAIVLEGDPSPSIHDYYRSFGYIGKIRPFNKYDHYGNFGITVGMGDLDTSMTGFTPNDIREDQNPHVYAQFGEYTSNGMYSMSMYRTRSNVMFQSYYPAFITHLPNYPSVGTIPSELSTLILDKTGFQKSHWTDKYHASPIYMAHVAEGYRGFLDGVVAIHDHNLVNKDELLVDTEILKDPDNPGMGTWTEVYKFFSIKSPINFFKKSPSPDVMTVAILKEIK